MEREEEGKGGEGMEAFGPSLGMAGSLWPMRSDAIEMRCLNLGIAAAAAGIVSAFVWGK